MYRRSDGNHGMCMYTIINVYVTGAISAGLSPWLIINYRDTMLHLCLLVTGTEI